MYVYRLQINWEIYKKRKILAEMPSPLTIYYTGGRMGPEAK
jgi:hypothetical protein